MAKTSKRIWGAAAVVTGAVLAGCGGASFSGAGYAPATQVSAGGGFSGAGMAAPVSTTSIASSVDVSASARVTTPGAMAPPQPMAPMSAGGASAATGSQTIGVRTGGAQDMGLARAQIERGMVPQPSAYAPEGIFAEHDVVVDGPACTRRFCARPDVTFGEGPDGHGQVLYVTMGMGSGIDAQTFHRPALDLVVVVDHSGSMHGAKMDGARTALHALVRRLNSNDRLALVQFDDDVQVVRPFGNVEHTDSIHAAIDRIAAEGGTDIESGLAVGYNIMHSVAPAPGRSRRVILITDAQPNIGRTDAQGFRAQATAGAQRGIGLTAMGVGVDFGQDLALAVSRTRGGSYLFLENETRLAQVFDQDFDFLMTPLAYDLEIRLSPREGLAVTGAYGVPQVGAGERDIVIRAETVFASRGHGAMVVRLDQRAQVLLRPGTEVARMSVSYRHADGEAVVRDEVSATIAPEPSRASRKVMALVQLQQGLHESLTLFHAGHRAQAVARLSSARARVAEAAAALHDEELARDVRMMDDLRARMGGTTGAAQAAN